MGESDRLGTWTVALNLPDFEVVQLTEDEVENVLRFTVVPRLAVGVCPHCGGTSGNIRQKREREGTDLPLGGRPVKLKIRVFQFACPWCRKCFTPPSPAIAGGTRATKRLLEGAATLIRHGDIASAAAFFGLPEKTLERWYYDCVERQQRQPEADLQPIEAIGIDELSLKKSTGSMLP
jgi:transposase